MPRRISIRLLIALIVFVSAVFSCSYYFVKLRQECGALPLWVCMKEALVFDQPRSPLTKNPGLERAEREIAIRREREAQMQETPRRADREQEMLRRADAEREIAVRREREAQIERRRAEQFGRTPEFEWPPPKASARTLLPSNLFPTAKDNSLTLGDIAGHLQAALIRAGYGEHSYFRIGNNGFALVTRVERLTSNGAPDQHYRWCAPDATEPFSLFKYILGLVWPEPGYYRLIVFIATPEMFSNTGREVTSQDASRKLSLGVAVLPRSLSDQPFTNDHHCFALIYEFEKAKPESVPVLLDPSRFSAMEHLEKTAIWAELQK
jgi:hypothetical protein